MNLNISNMASSLAFIQNSNPATSMNNYPWFSLKETKPEEKHKNSAGQVDFQHEHYSSSGRWDYIPEDATHWRMISDPAPIEGADTWQEIKKKAYRSVFNELFPNPIVERALLEPMAWKLFEAGTKCSPHSYYPSND